MFGYRRCHARVRESRTAHSGGEVDGGDAFGEDQAGCFLKLLGMMVGMLEPAGTSLLVQVS